MNMGSLFDEPVGPGEGNPETGAVGRDQRCLFLPTAEQEAVLLERAVPWPGGFIRVYQATRQDTGQSVVLYSAIAENWEDVPAGSRLVAPLPKKDKRYVGIPEVSFVLLGEVPSWLEADIIRNRAINRIPVAEYLSLFPRRKDGKVGSVIASVPDTQGSHRWRTGFR